MARFPSRSAALCPKSALALAVLVALHRCAPDAGLDLGHPPIPQDAELDDDALEPFSPENDGTDASAPEDATDAEAPMDATDPPDEGLVDASLSRPDAIDVRDVVPPRDVPSPPRMCTGSASGQSSIWTCTSDRSSRQRCVSGTVQTERCAHGCVPQPSGTNDYCAAAPPPTTLPSCARQSLLRWGLHAYASDRLRCAGVPASRITQTIGSAAASAGTHGQDGTFMGQPYSAATDISTRGLTNDEIRALLSRLANQGFAAWYRLPGSDGWPSSEAPHIHAIYVGAAMKASLRAQVSDWLIGRNGLTSHTTYRFYTWTDAQKALVRAVFNRYN